MPLSATVILIAILFIIRHNKEAAVDHDKSTMDLLDTITKTDKISFPKWYKVLEKIELNDEHNNWYEACIKVRHTDILLFTTVNNLKPFDTTALIFQPFDFALKKERLTSALSLPRLQQRGLTILADTNSNKIYISKNFLTDKAKKAYP